MKKNINKNYKTCTVCKETKPLDDFRFYKQRNYYQSKCKKCEKEYNKIIKNGFTYKEKQKEYQKKYRAEHKKERSLYNTQYYKERANKDLIYKLKNQIRRNVYFSFKRKSFDKYKYTEEIIGTNINDFVKHLLNTYLINYNVEYDGKEKVHIDHIIPLCMANTKEEVYKLCHYTNLQLLKAQDNLEKGRSVV